jgi:hypothetical protein
MPAGEAAERPMGASAGVPAAAGPLERGGRRARAVPSGNAGGAACRSVRRHHLRSAALH